MFRWVIHVLVPQTKRHTLDEEAPVLTLKLPCLINQNHHSHDEYLAKRVFVFVQKFYSLNANKARTNGLPACSIQALTLLSVLNMLFEERVVQLTLFNNGKEESFKSKPERLFTAV